MTTLLEIRDLRVDLAGKPVVEVDALTLQTGEVLAIVGPNGAGKSSLLLAIARLLKPKKGSIHFNGFPVSSRDDINYRRQLGLVLQEPLLLDASVSANVASGLHFRHLPTTIIQARVKTWLLRLGISHLASKNACALSGGEAQRVSLARAFALQPQLLLLDEPFSSLDAPTRLRLIEDLHGILAETHTSTLLITHDLNEASRLGDRLAVILSGRLHQIGTPQEVRNHPLDEAVRQFFYSG